MRFATRHISRAHLDLSTTCRSYTCNSDAERSLAINLRSCLRRRGPLPLSRLSGLLSPPVMELLEDIPGGLLEFCRQQSNMFVVTSLQNIHVVNAREFLNQVTPEDRDVVAAAVGWLTAAMYFPQRVKISPQPTLHDLLQVLPDCTLTLMELEKCLRRNPDVFKVSARPDCRVSLAAASGTKYEGAGASTTNVLAPTAMFTEGVVSVAPPAPEAKPFELSPTVYHLVLHLCKRGAATHYIPLSHTFPQEGEIFSSFGEEPWWCSTVENFTTAMTSIPEGVFDVRSFCPTRMNRTFVRVLNLPALVSLVSDPSSFTMTEEEVQRFQVFTIGERAVAELKAFSLESHVNQLRLTKGLTMTQVSEVLSKELVNDIHRTLSGAEEPFNPEESSNADLLILVFDRLRHIFDVSFSDQTIRVWSLLPPAQQPSSLLWESSPLPLVLFDLLEALAERPRGVTELLHHLHPARRMQLVKLYVNANHAELPEEECAALQQALREFITHHSLYLFLDQTKDGDLVVTPQLAKMQQLCKEPQKNDDARRGSALSGASSSNDDIARRVWDILPANDFLSEKKVRTLFSRNEGTLSETETLRTDFFTRRPHLFQVEEAYCGHIRFIGRAGIRTTPQQQENLKPPIRSLDEVIRAVALSSVKGASAGNIMMELPPQARSMVKRIGSLSDLVEAMPQWFAVQRDALNESSTLITFIGVPSRDIDAAEEGQATPLKKVINHDFSSLTSAATKKADEGWHADWNE